MLGHSNKTQQLGSSERKADQIRGWGQNPLADLVQVGQNLLADSVRWTNNSSEFSPPGPIIARTDFTVTPAFVLKYSDCSLFV